MKRKAGRVEKPFFRHRVYCWNCDHYTIREIPKGMKTTEYVKNDFCKKCKVKGQLRCHKPTI